MGHSTLREADYEFWFMYHLRLYFELIGLPAEMTSSDGCCFSIRLKVKEAKEKLILKYNSKCGEYAQ